MSLTIARAKKQANAGWSAKVKIDSAGHVEMSESTDSDLSNVEVLWYPNGEIKVIVRDAGPLAIEQFYRSDKQTIVKLTER